MVTSAPSTSPGHRQVSPVTDNGVPEYASKSLIAEWCGVSPSSVSNWLSRYTDYPPPAITVRSPKGADFAWPMDSREAWVEWARPEPRNAPRPRHPVRRGETT